MMGHLSWTKRQTTLQKKLNLSISSLLHNLVFGPPHENLFRFHLTQMFFVYTNENSSVNVVTRLA